MPKEIFLVCGARPNFIKIIPLIDELKRRNIQFKLVHTGQHYDNEMSKIFFEELEIPKPDFFLNVGSGTHAFQTGKIMIEFDKILDLNSPELVIVVGDVNSTLACALVSKKRLIKVAHVEAGLRSFDKTMPEEINRILTDQISDFLFITERSAELNLLREGIDQKKIYYVGNVMIDTLLKYLDKIENRKTFNKFNVEKRKFTLLTLHRPSNVDNKIALNKILKILEYTSKKLPILFPVHPRTLGNLRKFNLEKNLKKLNIILTEPLGYLDFLNLMKYSRFILTDSGGIQEEASILGIPVLTLRKNTERPITIEKGTNTIVGINFIKAKKYINKILNNEYKKGQEIDLWDGKAAIRIVDVLYDKIKFNT